MSRWAALKTTLAVGHNLADQHCTSSDRRSELDLVVWRSNHVERKRNDTGIGRHACGIVTPFKPPDKTTWRYVNLFGPIVMELPQGHIKPLRLGSEQMPRTQANHLLLVRLALVVGVAIQDRDPHVLRSEPHSGTRPLKRLLVRQGRRGNTAGEAGNGKQVKDQ